MDVYQAVVQAVKLTVMVALVHAPVVLDALDVILHVKICALVVPVDVLVHV